MMAEITFSFPAAISKGAIHLQHFSYIETYIPETAATLCSSERWADSNLDFQMQNGSVGNMVFPRQLAIWHCILHRMGY